MGNPAQTCGEGIGANRAKGISSMASWADSPQALTMKSKTEYRLHRSVRFADLICVRSFERDPTLCTPQQGTSGLREPALIRDGWFFLSLKACT
jgi:hypothetical protein